MYDQPYVNDPYPQPLLYRLAYPPIDIGTFTQSVSSFQNLALDASTLLKKFAEPPFAYRLMTAAQAGNETEVNRLIASIGISTAAKVQYTPTGILLTMNREAQGSQCCTLTMYLKWGV